MSRFADVNSGLTAETLRSLLDYDHETGQLTWKVSRTISIKVGDRAGSINKNGYVVVVLKVGDQPPRAFKAHRLIFLWITGRWPTRFVDHIDGCRSNNRWANLRDANESENAQNQRSAHRNKTKSCPLGVTWHKRLQRWQAKIRVGGRSRHIGTFDSAEQAHAAYLDAKRQFHPGLVA